MPAAIKPGFIQHLWHQPMLFEIVLGVVVIATKESGGDQNGCDHFGIPHLDTTVFAMSDRFEQIVGDGIDRYNFGKHFSSLQALQTLERFYWLYAAPAAN
jgi:hypothetical protein